MPPCTVLIAGAAGFLSRHLQIQLRALTDHVVRTVDQHNWHGLPQLVADADAVIHLAAGNNRVSDELRDDHRWLHRAAHPDGVNERRTLCRHRKGLAARIAASSFRTRSAAQCFIDALEGSTRGKHFHLRKIERLDEQPPMKDWTL